MNKPFEEVTPEQFDLLFHVNIRAMFLLTQAMIPGMVQQDHGAVINLSSVHAFAGMTEHTVYAATKGAIVAFTRVLALEMGTKVIRINAIAPGGVLVENHLKVMPDMDPEAVGQTLPAGCLAADDARYIGGQTAIMPLTGDFRDRRSEQFGQGYVPGL